MIVEISQPRPIDMPAARSHTGQNNVPLSQLPAASTNPALNQTGRYPRLQRLITEGRTRPSPRHRSADKATESGTAATIDTNIAMQKAPSPSGLASHVTMPPLSTP